MAYLLNTVNISSYGITPGHAPGSNIAVEGCFNMPERIGKTFHEWGDEHSIEPYTATGDLFFAGRDIVFYGSVIGTNGVINSYLKSFYTAIKALTGLVTFSTPYGDFSVFVKDVKDEYLNGGCRVIVTFREPVVTLTGTLPSAGDSSCAIDAIPFNSFGIYLSKPERVHDLPEAKSQLFTKYASEGYQITKRKHSELDFNGFIIASSLADFQSKISALYKLFSSAGTRNIKINDEITVDCFAAQGFKVENIIMHSSGVVANFKMSLLSVNVNYLNYLLTSDGDNILTAAGDYILI